MLRSPACLPLLLAGFITPLLIGCGPGGPADAIQTCVLAGPLPLDKGHKEELICDAGRAVWLVAVPASVPAVREMTNLGVPSEVAAMIHDGEATGPVWCAAFETPVQDPPPGFRKSRQTDPAVDCVTTSIGIPKLMTAHGRHFRIAAVGTRRGSEVVNLVPLDSP